jgi:hypothetical protein
LECCEVAVVPEVCSASTDVPKIKGLLRKPSAMIHKQKKSVRFNDKNIVTTFDAPLSENHNPKVKEKYDPKDVSEFRASTGKWWDENEDETNDLYNLNMDINGLCPLVNDHDQLRKTTFATKMDIYEAKLLNYHQYPNPFKFLLGEFLSTKATPFLMKYSENIAKKLKDMIEKIIDDFENDRIEVYPFYQSGTRILKENMGLLRSRINIINKYLIQA